jgi:hypothetical protein
MHVEMQYLVIRLKIIFQYIEAKENGEIIYRPNTDR